MKEKENIIEWAKEHKIELMVGAVGVVVALTGTAYVVKNWDSIKPFFHPIRKVAPTIAEATPAIKQDVAPLLPKGILDNLTGTMLTARALGREVGCSAQEINKRIVGAGLAEKLPCGEYKMTAAGSMLGKNTLKTTAAGHTFSNIEWDEKILDVIFSQEELMDITAKRNRGK